MDILQTIQNLQQQGALPRVLEHAPTLNDQMKLHPSVLKVLLDMGLDVNQQDDEGNTLLHLATQAASLARVRLLLERGALADQANHAGLTPRQIAADLYAASNRYNVAARREMLSLLSPLPDLEQGRQLLERADQAIAQGDVAALEQCLALAKPFLSEADLPFEKLVFSAVLHNQAACIQPLVKTGLTINLQDHANNSPLHQACMEQKTEVAVALLNAGAAPNTLGQYGFTPLHWAYVKNNSALINALLQAGADPNLEQHGVSTSTGSKKPAQLVHFAQ